MDKNDASFFDGAGDKSTRGGEPDQEISVVDIFDVYSHMLNARLGQLGGYSFVADRNDMCDMTFGERPRGSCGP